MPRIKNIKKLRFYSKRRLSCTLNLVQWRFQIFRNLTNIIYKNIISRHCQHGPIFEPTTYLTRLHQIKLTKFLWPSSSNNFLVIKNHVWQICYIMFKESITYYITSIYDIVLNRLQTNFIEYIQMLMKRFFVEEMIFNQNRGKFYRVRQLSLCATKNNFCVMLEQKWLYRLPMLERVRLWHILCTFISYFK